MDKVETNVCGTVRMRGLLGIIRQPPTNGVIYYAVCTKNPHSLLYKVCKRRKLKVITASLHAILPIISAS